MQTSKFITLLATLDKKELAHYFKYLKKNHGNENIALQVFEYIRKYHSRLKSNKKLDIAYAHEKIFGSDITDEDYNRTRMLNALSDLHLWLKDFLLALKVQGNGFEGHILWLGILQERGLKEEFSRLAGQFYAEKERIDQQDSAGFSESLIANYFQFQNLSLPARSPDITGLERCMEEMKRCIELQNLKMACFVKNLTALLPPKQQQEPSTSPQPSPEPPLLLLYREIHAMLMTEEERHFTILENEFMVYADQISPNELNEVVKYLHNYVATQLRKGKEVAFVERVHALNKLGLDKGIFIVKGEISAQHFINIVNIACGAKDMHWASKFVDAHYKYLSAEIAEGTRLLSNAIILFEKKAFKLALKNLDKANFASPLLNLRVRSLALKCLFELQEDGNTILDYCVSFELQLRSTKMPKIQAVTATLNFIKFVKKLVLERVEKQQLLAQIEQEGNVYFKHWLLQKAAVYKARYAPKPKKTRAAYLDKTTS